MEIRLLMIGEGGRGEYGFSSVYVCMYGLHHSRLGILEYPNIYIYIFNELVG